MGANDLTFHHVGVATDSIAIESEVWVSLGYRFESEPFTDHALSIRGQFMISSNGNRVELLEPTNGLSTLTPWLRRRVKFYHMGYLAKSFDKTIVDFVAKGATVTRPPMTSIYFKRKIAFLMMPNIALVELIDATP
jgi:hypothetical protein